jgi:DNA-binding NarL/FixJ family response regulator
MKVPVVIIDEHAAIREMVALVLAGEGHYEVVGHAGTGPEALRVCREHKPELVILELVLPGLSGLEVLRTLRSELPLVRWLVFSSTVQREAVRRVLLDNPHGFVHKRDELADFHEALRAVARGRSYFTPFAMQCRGGEGASLCPAAVLTEREREVLRMIAEGQTSKEMAARLEVACRTVEHHRSNLMEKLKIHDIARLTRFAVQVGLVPVEL